MTIPGKASETARLCRQGRLGPVEVVKECFERIDRVEPAVEAVLFDNREQALEIAERLEKPPPEKRKGLLFGVPVAVKDNICTEGIPTTCGSRILENFRPPYSATVVERLLAQGGIPVVKTNMDEFAMGSSTEKSAFKKTFNPWGRDSSPGGSSGGSAAIVAAGAVPAALGSDTGGSIRQPAALCGVVGFRPTYGRVSRYGLIAFASSMDQIGPIAADVEDAALLFQAVAGHDPRDSTSLPGEAPDVLAGLEEGIAGLRIGFSRVFSRERAAPAVREAFESSLAVIEGMGATLVAVDLPHAPFALAAYYITAMSEASSNLARYDGVRYGFRMEGGDNETSLKETRGRGFGREVKMRVMLGAFSLSEGYREAYYRKAYEVRRLIAGDFERAFEKADLIVSPASPVALLRIGERIDDPLSMYECDIFTTPASLAGIPAASVPSGTARGGFPMGLQIMGPPLADGLVLRAARAFERSRPSGPIRSPLAAAQGGSRGKGERRTEKGGSVGIPGKEGTESGEGES